MLLLLLLLRLSVSVSVQSAYFSGARCPESLSKNLSGLLIQNIYSPDALPVSQPAGSEHLRKEIMVQCRLLGKLMCKHSTSNSQYLVLSELKYLKLYKTVNS